MHGHEEEAEANVARIEARGGGGGGTDLDPVPDDKAIEIPIHDRVPFAIVAHTFFTAVPEAHPRRVHDDGDAVVPLQRDLLHLRDRADAPSTRCPTGQIPAVLHPVRDRQPGRPAHPRTAVRLDRPQADDLRDLRDRRGRAGGLRRAVPGGRAHRGDADDLLVRLLLLRVGRRLLRLPDGQRDVPAAAARSGDLVLLLDRADRRRRRPVDLRPPDRGRASRGLRSPAGTTSARG